MNRACKAIGIDDARTHDLRRTGATHLAKMKTPPYVIERLLNHAQKGVTARHYMAHLYDQERQEALDAWSNKILETV